MEKKPILVFDDSVKERITEALGYSKTENNELISKNGKFATSQEFEIIKFEEFGGMLQGSKIAIKKEDSELVKFFTTKRY